MNEVSEPIPRTVFKKGYVDVTPKQIWKEKQMKVLYLIGTILTLISILNFAEIDMAYESSLNLVQNLDQIRNQ